MSPILGHLEPSPYKIEAARPECGSFLKGIISVSSSSFQSLPMAQAY